MIVDKIYSFLENEKELGTEDAFSGFLGEVEHGFRRQFMEEKQTKNTLRLSAIGKCMRQQYLNVKGYEPEPFNPRTLITFWQGDLIEACTNALAKMAGADIRRDQEEVNIEGIKGHIDGVVYENKEPKAVLEIKSMSDFGFKRFAKEGIDNAFGYVEQGVAYATDLDLDAVLWVATNKNTGHMEEHYYTVTDDMKSQLVDRVKTIKHYVNGDVIPDREYEPDDKGKLPLQCQYCSQKHNCYGKLETVIVRGKPQFYTVDDDEVA